MIYEQFFLFHMFKKILIFFSLAPTLSYSGHARMQASKISLLYNFHILNYYFVCVSELTPPPAWQMTTKHENVVFLSQTCKACQHEGEAMDAKDDCVSFKRGKFLMFNI